MLSMFRSIGAKLAMFATLMAMMLAGLGWLSSAKLAHLYEDGAEIGEVHLPAARAVGDLAFLSARWRTLQARALLADTPAEVAAGLADLPKITRDIETAFGALRNVVKDTANRALIATAEREVLAYRRIDQMVATAAAGAEKARVIDQWQSEGLEAFQRMAQAVEALEAAIQKAGADAVADSRSVYEATRWSLLAMIAAGVALAIAISALLIYSISTPIRRAAAALDALGAGRDVELPYASRGDEIGTMARSYLALKDKVLESMKLKQMVEGMPIGIMTANAKKNWTIDYMNPAFEEIFEPIKAHLPIPVDSIVGQSIDIFHRNPGHQRALLNNPANYPMTTRVSVGGHAFGLNLSAIKNAAGEVIGAMVSWQDVTEQMQVADRFEASVKVVVDKVGKSALAARDQADSMSQASSASEGSAKTVAAAAEEASTSVSAVAAGSEELMASIAEISRQVIGSNEIARKAVGSAAHAGDVIRSLDAASQKIGQIVDLIGNIAAQTNLLALNATIEAARAGDAGRGFAVVASEVKQLAAQTAKATEEIVGQIQAIQGSTANAVTAIGTVSETIDELSKVSGAIAAAIEEQSAATQEIASNAHQTAHGANQVSAALGAITDATRRGGEASRAMFDAATTLTDQAQALQREVDAFLSSVRIGDRRKATRVKREVTATVVAGGARRQVTLRDLSRAGAMVTPGFPVKAGEKVTLIVAGREIASRAMRASADGVAIQFDQELDSLAFADGAKAA